MEEIRLGDKVKCKITGYTGIATSKTEFINGCVQIEVTAKIKKGEKLTVDSMSGIGIDLGSLEKVNDGINKKVSIKKDSNGGPMNKSIKMRGF